MKYIFGSPVRYRSSLSTQRGFCLAVLSDPSEKISLGTHSDGVIEAFCGQRSFTNDTFILPRAVAQLLVTSRRQLVGGSAVIFPQCGYAI